MTIDERLEALTHSVELLSRNSQDMDRRHEALAQSVELLTRDVRDMRGFIVEVAEGTARLLHIAEIHENRLTRLEGGQS